MGSRHDEEQARVSLGWEACLPQGGSRPDPWHQKSSTLLKAAPEAWRQQPVQCLLSAQTARLLRHAAQVLGQGQGERGAPTCSGVPVSSSLFSVCSVRSSRISLQFMFFRRWPCGRADEWSGGVQGRAVGSCACVNAATGWDAAQVARAPAGRTTPLTQHTAGCSRIPRHVASSGTGPCSGNSQPHPISAPRPPQCTSSGTWP